MTIAISAGHGKLVRGAAGPSPWGLDEVDEARKVVSRLKELMTDDAVIFWDDTSTTQDQNLKTIVNWHNAQKRTLDVSVHFNAYTVTDGARGTECLWVTQQEKAIAMASAMASAGEWINRGDKKRTDLYFLNKTTGPSILIETCFVDAQADVDAYHKNFEAVCRTIAAQLGVGVPPVEIGSAKRLQVRGKVSWFGGPEDMGVSPSEGLAFLYKVADKPAVFLKKQPEGTTGLARRLDPSKRFLAMRWDYDQFSKKMLAGVSMALVKAPKTGKEFEAHPADWGPNSSTGRVADISKGLMDELGITTDDDVEVTYPVRRRG